mgnify:FL=1
MPDTPITCAYGGATIACHWTFGLTPPLPPEWVQSWLGQILSQFPHLGLLDALRRVDVWSPDRADMPQVLKLHQEYGGYYLPGTRSIILNAGKATKAVLSHEFGHHVQQVLVEHLASGFAATFGQIGTEPAPGAREFFEWAATQGGM